MKEFLCMFSIQSNRSDCSVPGEGAANAEIQFLTGIYWQGFIAVGLTQAVHGTPDISVGDGTELGSVNCLPSGVGPVHHWLDSVQDLRDKRSRD